MTSTDARPARRLDAPGRSDFTAPLPPDDQRTLTATVAAVAVGRTDSRAWTRGLFADLARAAGAADPEELGRRLVLLYDGATIGAAMDRNPATAAEARAMAELLLDAPAPASRGSKRGTRKAAAPRR